jgi:penicillin-binding protein 1A
MIIATGTLVTLLIAGILGATVYIISLADQAPDPNTLQPVIAGSSSEVFASNGKPLGFINSDVLRTPVRSREIPAVLKEATVAIEDERFYHHNGVDFQGIVRAAVKDLVNGRTVQGGSTITMQLMRNLYLGRDTRTLKQKVQEAKMAMDYEKEHPKDFILTQYLNTIPYGTVGGQTALGVGAAARVFFNKPVSRLTLAQAALLAGLPQAPSEYNPFLNKAAALARRDQVLAKMAQLHYISAGEAAAAIASPLAVHPNNYYNRHSEPFFFDYVKQQLIDRYGIRTVEQGGLRVYTTIDLQMQQQARNAIAGILNEQGDPASAIVTENPKNGYIEAMAESAAYDSSQFNLAAQGLRQAGSTFKAIVLADALEHGIDPNSTYYVSHTLPDGWLPGYPTYNVHTFENTSLNQSMNLVTATVESDNTVYAQLAADLGEQTVTAMARKMGVVSPLYSFPSEALGGLKYGVSPLEMSNVYATLADGGWRNTPIAITHVVFPDHHTDTSWGKPHRVKVLSDAITSEETTILAQNIQSGTAAAANISCPAAAKTGTTSYLTDAWLDGYTPRYSTVVWMGYPKKTISMTDVHGQPQQGGALPAQIWHAYMSQVVGNNCVSFPQPSSQISYHPFYGKFASSGGSCGSVQTSTGVQTSSSSQGCSGYQGYQSYGAGSGSSSSSGASGNGTGNGGTGSGGGRGGGTGHRPTVVIPAPSAPQSPPPSTPSTPATPATPATPQPQVQLPASGGTGSP